MHYRDLLPGDVIIEQREVKLVISMKKIDYWWIMIKFAHYYGGKTEIYDLSCVMTWQVTLQGEVVRNALWRLETW